MSNLLTQLLGQALAILWARLLNPNEDTSKVEAEIIAARTPKDVQDIAIREAIAEVAEITDEPTAELVSDLVATQNKNDLIEVVEKHKGNILTNIVDFLGAALVGIGELLFGKK